MSQKLGRLVLEYFRDPQKSKGLTDAEQFQEFEPLDVRKAMYGLEKAGLLIKVRGVTSDAVYMLTELGAAVLDTADDIEGGDYDE